MAPPTPTTYQPQARAETTKRLLAQVVNEGLVSLCLSTKHQEDGILGCYLVPNLQDNHSSRRIQVIVNGVLKKQGLWRPNDFHVPVLLFSSFPHDDSGIEEDDPGSIFEFIAPWFACEEGTKGGIAAELRNSAAMSEKWIEIAAKKPVLDLNSSFLEWEQALITGHPTHPFHRTCFADKLLKPVGPDDLPDMLNPGLSFVVLPHSSVDVFGPFVQLTRPLLKALEINPENDQEGKKIIIPCLTQQLPAVLHFFPEATPLKTTPQTAQAHAAIRTASFPGYAFDMKFSLACRITSATRALPCWAATAAPPMTDIMRAVLPPEGVWVFGEVAAVTGSQGDKSQARHLTCILRESLEGRAKENGEALVLASGLIEKPFGGGGRTYAEIVFDLTTAERKMHWFTSYIKCILPLTLYPLLHHGVGCELHPQNTVLRIHRKTKTVKGFAIRDLAGIAIHKPTLEAQDFDLSDVTSLCTDDVQQVWNRVHHALVQNHVGYMLYALGLEGEEYDGWGVVRDVLGDVLGLDGVGKEVYDYFVKDTMPFKCFMRMRIDASSKTSSVKLVETNVPNILSQNQTQPPWLTQLSLSSTKTPQTPIHPNHLNPSTRLHEKEVIHTALANNVRPYGAVSSETKRLNPFPALLPRQFIMDLERFHEALILALDNIVERWWKDKEAGFPVRMPLASEAEELLRWVNEATDAGLMHPFKGHQGNLRPDILLPDTGNPGETLEFRICEINGRFPISFLHHVAISNEALTTANTWHNGLEPATDHKALFDSLCELFDPRYRIYFLRGSLDSIPEHNPLFGNMEERTGFRPRLISPDDLRLVPDARSRTGFVLCCVNPVPVSHPSPNTTTHPSIITTAEGEMEQIHQTALQLIDYELFALPKAIQHHIVLTSRNDPRTIFLVHDKRILGIIRQELPALVYKHNVLSKRQAALLERSIIPTILPGDGEMELLLEQTRQSRNTGVGDHANANGNGKAKDDVKTGYILKPIRQARGAGILLGKHLSHTQWESILADLTSPTPTSAAQYILQPLLTRLCTLPRFWDEERKTRDCRMVGNYFSVNGRFVGVGGWRTVMVGNVNGEEQEVISASTREAMQVLSVMPCSS